MRPDRQDPDDLDNGRLIYLIGVAQSHPDAFLISRIGPCTPDARTVGPDRHRWRWRRVTGRSAAGQRRQESG